MPSFSTPEDSVKRVVIEPGITRACWSRRRAWHGDQVRLFVETEYVPDGTPVKVEIWEDDSAEGSPDDKVAVVEGDLKIEKNRCVVDYTLSWDEASLGAELELEGGDMEFYFKARIDKFNLEGRSTLLYVDLNEFEVSS